MKKKSIFAVVVLLLGSLAAALSVRGATEARVSQDQPRSLDTFMRLKLEHSKEILEGLALDDHEKIAKHSQALNLLSLESGWNVVQTEEYLSQSRDFRNIAKSITEAAHEKNVERAALGYVALTVRCVECHRYLRKHHPELSPE